MLMMKRILAILAVSMVGALALGCGDETGTSGSGGAGGGGGGAGGESGGAGGGSGGAGGGSGGSAATGCERFGYVASGMSCDPGCTAVMCECDPFPRSITACTADGCIVAATCSEVCAASSLMEAVDCTDTYVVQGMMP